MKVGKGQGSWSPDMRGWGEDPGCHSDDIVVMLCVCKCVSLLNKNGFCLLLALPYPFVYPLFPSFLCTRIRQF